MVKAIIDIDKRTNDVLNIVKAEYGLKDKSQAINRMAEEYKRFVKIEPEIRPEYLKKLMKIHKGKHTKAISIKELKKQYGLE